MEFTTFVRKPFTIQAVQITKENLDEVAEELSGKILTDEKGNRYILPDSRLVPNVVKVWPGYWMTKFGSKIRCYSRKAFAVQFSSMTPELATLLDEVNGYSNTPSAPVSPMEVNVNGDDSVG